MKSICNTLLLVLIACFTQLSAQPFSAYTNIRQEFYVFDNGAVNKLEPLIPRDYKIGRSAVAYLDNLNNFKVYRDGAVSSVSDLLTTNFQVSDNLIAYQNANILSVMDGSDIVLLSRLCNNYALGDSVVLFYDLNKQTFNGYHAGEITELETFLNIDNTDFRFDSTVKVSDNIGAYISFNNQFKVFYNNTSEIIENQPVNEFKLGRNTLAYVDINNIFKVYHKGQTYQLDPFKPKSFMVGDDLVAFQTSDGYFKIFYDGRLLTIGYYEPRYEVKDWVIAYEAVNGFFNVFYGGEQIMVDNFYPDKLDMGYHSLTYVNRANMLRMFSKGKVYDISTMTLNEVRLDYDVLQYRIGVNAFKMFYDGNHY